MSTEAPRKPRGLFEFHDGVKDRCVDPWKAVMLIREKLPLESVQSFSTKHADIGPLVAATRAALVVPEWDEATGLGLTEAEMAELTARFLNFVDSKKKALELQPT